MTLAALFGPFDGRTWLNTAHQGALPRAAAAAGAEAVAEKVAPARIDDVAFHRLPAELKDRLGRLIGARSEDIVLGNSTTYGLHLLARGLPLRAGDEVLFVAGEYPATVVPWLPLRRHGIRIRRVEPSAKRLPPGELRGGAHAAHASVLLQLGLLALGRGGRPRRPG
jgi:cysteine desulfurase/selenocysteine lyase